VKRPRPSVDILLELSNGAVVSEDVGPVVKQANLLIFTDTYPFLLSVV